MRLEKESPGWHRGGGYVLALRRKDNRSRSAESIAARRFGISEEAFCEIEDTVGKTLTFDALTLARNPHWTQPDRFIHNGRCDTSAVAREFGTKLQNLLVKAALQYVSLLTETITKHRGNRKSVHWNAIYSQAEAFCDSFIWRQISTVWLANAFEALDIDSKRIRPREIVAFRAVVGTWTWAARPKGRTIEEKAREQITHIALLAPAIKPTASGGRPFPNLTKAMIARIKLDHPDWLNERICIELDARRVPIPTIWKKHEFFLWQSALADPKFNPRVKTYISKVPREIRN